MTKSKYAPLPKNAAGFIAVSAITAIVYFILNDQSGYVIDDFNYSFLFERFRISDNPVLLSSLSDIYEGMITHYLVWSGRIPVHAVAQLLLMFDKALFNVLNTLMVVLLGFLIYFHANYGKKHNFMLYLAVHIMLYFLIPTPDQTIFFLTGAINYLWTCVLVLLFMVPFRIYFENKVIFRHSTPLLITMIPFGFFAGCSNEPSALAAVFMIVIITGTLIKEKVKIPSWFYSAFLSLLAGFGVMVLAPGYRQKAGDLHDADNIIVYAWKNFGEISRQVFGLSFSALWPLLVLFCTMFYVFIKIHFAHKNRHQKKSSAHAPKSFFMSILPALIYAGCAAAGICMYLVSPEFTLRYLFSPAVFFIISTGAFVRNIQEENTLNKKLIHKISILLITLCCVVIPLDFSREYRIISYNHMLQTQIEQEISSQVEQGQKDVVLTGEFVFQPGGKFSLYHTGAFSLSQLWGNPDSDYEVNRVLAAFFGAETYTNEAQLGFTEP